LYSAAWCNSSYFVVIPSLFALYHAARQLT
jgi:hypothetical protein